MNKAQSITLILFFATIAFFSAKESLNKNDLIEGKDNEIDELRDSLETYKEEFKEKIDSMKNEEIRVITLVRENVEAYNPDVTDESIRQFLKTMKKFNLNEDEKDFKILLSQLLYESGFQQHYSSKHYKVGELVTSSGNAIGICQIVPNTGYHYLRMIKNSNELHLLEELGCTDLNIVKDFKGNIPNSNQRQKVIDWLSIEKNNFALWGYIMKHTLDKRGSFVKTLVAYNAGGGYLNSYLRNGNNPNSFSYVVKINQIARRVFV